MYVNMKIKVYKIMEDRIKVYLKYIVKRTMFQLLNQHFIPDFYDRHK